MKSFINKNSTSKPNLRLWPGIVIVILQWVLRYVVPIFEPDFIVYGVFGVVLFGLGIVIWWLFFSRAQKLERWLPIPLAIASLYITSTFLDKSIATANVGLMFAMYSIPVVCLACVVWALATKNLSPKIRLITMLVTILVSTGFWTLIRTDGMDAEIHHNFSWRWAKTSEERLINEKDYKSTIAEIDSISFLAGAEWPGFRGANRDGKVMGTRIKTNWNESKPVELWRKPIGPGCSSFAIHGKYFFTQEQRGEYEMVICYNLTNGELVWIHSDSTRFWDAHAGAGPRSTPTIQGGRVYTFGATGILNVLNERTGSVIWRRNLAKDTKVRIPGWAYTSSPLVIDSTLLIAISGQILAYDIFSGNLRWSGLNGGESYSSPHLFVSNGVKQVVFIDSTGVDSYAPNNGNKLWSLNWRGIRVVQPCVIDENDLLIGAEERIGLKRISVSEEAGIWNVKEKWTTNKLRPDYNDFVIHKGHIFGFDGPSIACIDLENGNRKWKGGRYGGQMLLLASQDLLLILTETGDIALVKATPDSFNEVAKIPAIKGKTWNHPALANNILLVRNAIEMAAYKLPTE